jgi:hypothetical protein
LLRTGSIACLVGLGVFRGARRCGIERFGAAKKQSEANGFIFEENRASIIAKAKQEGGKIRVLSSFDPELFPHMSAGFKKKVPISRREHGGNHRSGCQ